MRRFDRGDLYCKHLVSGREQCKDLTMTPFPTNSARVIVVGSTNTDLVVTVPHLPRPGETVLGGDVRQLAGGKGANQAVAVARLGGDAVFIGRVGDDEYGRQTLVNLQAEGIETRYLRATAGVPSGVALISVCGTTGENSIVVAPGANAQLTAEDIQSSEDVFETARVVVISLEIPLVAVEAAVSLGRKHGLQVLLNPAPARALPSELLADVDIITPNQHELEVLGGVSSLLAAGVKAVVTTLGSEGAEIETTKGSLRIPPWKVAAVDTVAAGDCFTGALAVELARGTELQQALRFATIAAALKVTRSGAQTGIPRRLEVEQFLNTTE